MRRFNRPARSKSAIAVILLILFAIPEIYGAGETQRYDQAQKISIPEAAVVPAKEKTEFFISCNFIVFSCNRSFLLYR